MKEIKLEKVVLNMGVGKSGDAIEPGEAVLFNVGFSTIGTEICFQDLSDV